MNNMMVAKINWEAAEAAAYALHKLAEGQGAEGASLREVSDALQALTNDTDAIVLNVGE